MTCVELQNSEPKGRNLEGKSTMDRVLNWCFSCLGCIVRRGLYGSRPVLVLLFLQVHAKFCVGLLFFSIQCGPTNWPTDTCSFVKRHVKDQCVQRNTTHLYFHELGEHGRQQASVDGKLRSTFNICGRPSRWTSFLFWFWGSYTWQTIATQYDIRKLSERRGEG